MGRCCRVNRGSPAVGVEYRRCHLRRQAEASGADAGYSGYAKEGYTVKGSCAVRSRVVTCGKLDSMHETVRHFEQVRMSPQRLIGSGRGVSSACRTVVQKMRQLGALLSQ